jgi:hypothetical protein
MDGAQQRIGNERTQIQEWLWEERQACWWNVQQMMAMIVTSKRLTMVSEKIYISCGQTLNLRHLTRRPGIHR